MMEGTVSLFDRLDKGRPTPKPTPTKKEPAQMLLDFLQRWTKPTISSRDIRIYGPTAIRDRESAIRSAQILAAQGWLVPLEARVWQVVRKNLAPSVARS